MHSSASRATDGTSSVRRACEDPNLRVMSEARNELSASAASSGTVIMGSSPYPCSQGSIANAQAKTVGHAAPLSGCADAWAVPLCCSCFSPQGVRRKRSQRFGHGERGALTDNLHASCGQVLILFRVSIPLVDSTHAPRSVVVSLVKGTTTADREKGPPARRF